VVAYALDHLLDPSGDAKRVEELEQCVSPEVRELRAFSFLCTAAAVFPEVSLSPQQLDLGTVVSGSGDFKTAARAVRVTNTGRVPAKISLLISPDPQAGEDAQQCSNCFCLQAVASEGQGPSAGRPAGRFSGLIAVDPGCSLELAVAPEVAQASALLREQGFREKRVTASLEVKVMTSGNEYSSAAIPVEALFTTATLAPVANGFRSRLHEDHLADTAALLFNLAGAKRQACLDALKHVPSSRAFEALRQEELRAYGPLLKPNDPDASSPDVVAARAHVYLHDFAANTPDDRPAAGEDVILTNASSTHLRFDVSPEVCKRLGVSVTPAQGHIHAGQSLTLHIRLERPTEAADDKKKKAQAPRTVLFGTPLLVRYYPIIFPPGRRLQPWDDSMTKAGYQVDPETNEARRVVLVEPEPENMCYVSEAAVRALSEEISSSTTGAKAKAQTKGKEASRSQEIERVLGSLKTPSSRVSLSSEFIELNLFGVAGDFTCKFLVEGDTISPKAQGEYQTLELPMASCPILQKVSADLLCLNEGIVSAPVDFEGASGPEPFSVEPGSEALYCRPDLLAAAVKETYPAIADNAAMSQMLSSRHGISAKGGTDKSAAAAFTQRVTAQNASNPYAVTCAVTFSPKTPGSFDQYLQASSGPYQLHLSSSASLPVCHIECPASTYLQRARPGSMKTPPLFTNLLTSNPSSVRVLELAGRGVGVKSTGSLSVLNCIATPFVLQLQRLSESAANISTSFGAGGPVAPGEKSVLTFDYTPTRDSVSKPAEEAFFLLRIVEHKLTVPLLVVGRPNEPELSLNTGKLLFGPLRVGESVTQELVISNKEAVALGFRIRRLSSTGRFEASVTPSAGMVPAHGTVAVAVTASPTVAGRVDAVLGVMVPSRTEPLRINLKYEGYIPSYTLELLPENEAGVPIQVVGSIDLDFGGVFVGDSRTRSLRLRNTGHKDLSISVATFLDREGFTQRQNEVDLARARESVRLGSSSAFQVPPGGEKVLDVLFAPKRDMTFDPGLGFSIRVTAEGGGSQRVRVIGAGLRPGIRASEAEVDFGVALSGLRQDRCTTRTLTLTNRDSKPLSLEYETDGTDFFVVTPPPSDHCLRGPRPRWSSASRQRTPVHTLPNSS